MTRSNRQSINSGAKWESLVGYSRAVRIGNVIEVSGTCSVDDQGNPYAIGDPYLQTKRILDIIKAAIEGLGGQMNDIIRTRMLVTDIHHWEEIGRAHGEYFKDIKPATTMVEVAGLIAEDYLVEIEASAIIRTS